VIFESNFWRERASNLEAISLNSNNFLPKKEAVEKQLKDVLKIRSVFMQTQIISDDGIQ
jgi:hypothetical protein